MVPNTISSNLHAHWPLAKNTLHSPSINTHSKLPCNILGCMGPHFMYASKSCLTTQEHQEKEFRKHQITVKNVKLVLQHFLSQWNWAFHLLALWCKNFYCGTHYHIRGSPHSRSKWLYKLFYFWGLLTISCAEISSSQIYLRLPT